MGSMRRCELCSQKAVLHCDADSAYLCWGCDAKIHGANFLVARHLRIILCCRCHEHTGLSTCVACPDADKCLCSGCTNSDCSDEISTTECSVSGRWSCKDGVIASGLNKCFDEDGHRLLEASTKSVFEVPIDKLSCACCEDASSLDSQTQGRRKKNIITRRAVALQSSGMKVQAILKRWCIYLNLRSPSTVPSAMHLVQKGLRKLGSLFRQKWRICLAASLWLAATLCENQASLPSIKRVEECSGVPSKLILVLESRLATVSEEGWAE